MLKTLRRGAGRAGLIALAVAAATFRVWAQAAPGAGQAETMPLAEVVVIGNTPLPGSGIDIDQVPANVQILTSDQLQRDGENDLVPTAAARSLSSVNLNAEQGSQFQPDFVYRGFEASPISGVPEGIAVYQNGVRINEAFGDTVNWDLVPQFAVSEMTLQSNNPVFGLNALGGAVSLGMKNGFDFHGSAVQLSGGSYGNVGGYAESGIEAGNLAFYGAIGGLHDDGFRYQSPTALRQGYMDLGGEKDGVTLHLSLSAADNDIAAVGPTPIQLLAENPKNVFTYPQAMHNEAELVQLTASDRPNDALLLSGDVYDRHFGQHLLDGNTTDVMPCANDASYFCLEGNDLYPADVLDDSHGDAVPTSTVAAGATPGEVDHTATDTNTIGAGLQATVTQPLWGHDNNFVIGSSYDHSSTDYSAEGELGTLSPDLDVIGSGVIIDQGLSATASPPIEQPVDVGATADYVGLFATDTFDVTPHLSATASTRFNLAEIGLRDRTGIAASLDSNSTYAHLNPGAGLTYKAGDAVTLYAGWSESNRAPTPAELTCANPANPCLLDAFLVSDPPLRQVVSRTVEFGLRGRFAPAMPGQFKWNLGFYRTDSDDDILLLATPINGFGFFENAGTTRRQGIEAGLGYNWEKWSVAANYSFLDATFRNAETLSSNSPAANPATGTIDVRPGDRIPLNPEHRIVLGVEYQAMAPWKIGGDVKYVGGQYLAGDESNQEPRLPGYATFDLHTAFELTSWATIFGEIDNLFDRTYYTYGTFAELDNLPPNYNLSDPRSLSPAPGRVFYGGVHISF